MDQLIRKSPSSKKNDREETNSIIRQCLRMVGRRMAHRVGFDIPGLGSSTSEKTPDWHLVLLPVRTRQHGMFSLFFGWTVVDNYLYGCKLFI